MGSPKHTVRDEKEYISLSIPTSVYCGFDLIRARYSFVPGTLTSDALFIFWGPCMTCFSYDIELLIFSLFLRLLG